MFQQTLDRRKRAGRHVGPRLDTLDDVLRMPNRSRQHLRIITVVTIHTHDLGDESHPVLANIVQTAYERRHIRRTGLGCQQSLTDGKDQRAVGADILAREILHGTNTVGRTREFDHDILVQGRQRFPFADHTVEIGGDHLGAHIAIDDGADFEVMATAGLLTANVLLGHQRRIGRHPVEHAHRMGLANLIEVSCIDKKFHSGKYLSNMKKQTNEPE